MCERNLRPVPNIGRLSSVVEANKSVGFCIVSIFILYTLQIFSVLSLSLYLYLSVCYSFLTCFFTSTHISRFAILFYSFLFYTLNCSQLHSWVVFLTSRLSDTLCHDGRRIHTHSDTPQPRLYSCLKCVSVLLTLLLLSKMKRGKAKRTAISLLKS